MRIIGGRFRGTRLATVGAGDRAAHLRPTADRVREAIFNLLLNGPLGDVVTGARVLDLFAGTGALGLEALSRGAIHATFIDRGAAAGALLAQNIARLGVGTITTVRRSDAARLGHNPEPGCDLVFLDPPHGQGLGERALTTALAGGWLAPDATVVWEEGTPPTLPAGITLLNQRRYGAAVVTLARPTTAKGK